MLGHFHDMIAGLTILRNFEPQFLSRTGTFGRVMKMRQFSGGGGHATDDYKLNVK